MFYTLPGPHGLPHNPFNALISPRPIGWISTVSAAGVVNLSPFSYFNACSSNPPTLMFCCNASHTEGGDKDTLLNIRQVPEFVVNIVSADFTEAMNETSTPAPRAINEFEVAKLEMAASRIVRPPHVAGVLAHVECRLHDIIDLPKDPETGQTNTMVIGLAVGVAIDDRVLVNGMVDETRVRPVARLGYMNYSVVEKVFAMKRPKWPKG